ncbi:MAG: SUMF1/EgtB/PvdO family nonheme iron enzyme [Magnetococcales bacterium]|nr:SUMF1/EgtB/PvdO family nonheme iron enzyme [Magnetococcales bacterium]
MALEQKEIFRALAQRIRELSAQDPPSPSMFDLLPGLRMLPVPGGIFTMGDDQGEYDDEKPAHRVQLSPFHLAETPVTNQQYRLFLEANRTCREPEYWKDERFSNDLQPVVGVDWNDAMKFCEWLSKLSGKEFFLPTEAQWEYAACGTDGRRYPWGNDNPTSEHACFDQQQDQPALVGQYPAGRGPFGHFDLAGNVWEWCRDVWDAGVYKKRATPVVKDPIVTEGNLDLHPVRGGSWFGPASSLRTGIRGVNVVGIHIDVLGFRLAASASFCL